MIRPRRCDQCQGTGALGSFLCGRCRMSWREMAAGVVVWLMLFLIAGAIVAAGFGLLGAAGGDGL